MHIKGRGIYLLTAIASVLQGLGCGVVIEYDGRKTPEYVVLQQYSMKISTAIAAELDKFKDALFSAGVIPDGSNNLMKDVLSDVEASPLKFYGFLHVLDERNAGNRYSQLLKGIDDAFRDEMRKYVPSKQAQDDCEVFISFSRRRAFGDESPDARKQAIELSEMLVKEGVRTWIDKNDLDTGDLLTEKIFLGLKHCKALVPVVTRGYAQSLWCLRELYFFSLVHSSENLFPIMTDEAEHLDRETAGRWLQKRVKTVKYFSLKFKQPQDLVKTLKEKYVQGTSSAPTVPTATAKASTSDAGASTVGAESSTNTEIKYFQELYDAVQEIGNWKDLCHNLKVNDAVMNALEFDPQHAIENKRVCLRAYFDMGEATWEDVVKAVEKYPFFNKRVGKQIANKYIHKKDEL